MNIKEKAKEFAIKAHKGQVRKSEINKPMIIHPINVGLMLESYGFDDNIVAAGYLHDVVEDTKYELEDIKENFNDDIESLVKGASEPDKSLSWEERKTHTINEIANLDFRHKVLAAADKINNLEDINRLMTLNKDFDFSLFNRGYDKQKWYYTNLANKLAKGDEHPIFDRLKETVETTFYNKENEALKYIYIDEFNLLYKYHLLKYEIKNIKNCLKIKPYVIELTGTPRTGKTSIINDLEDFFKKANFKVKVLEEFTSSKFYKENLKEKLKIEYKNVVNTEIPKYVNIQLEETLKEEIDIIIIDRSLFDRCIWIDRLWLKKGISKDELDDYYNKYIKKIKENIDIVIATYCSPEVAMKRDYNSNLSLEKRSFLNINNLEEYNTSLKNTIDLFSDNNYEVNMIDTDNISLKETKLQIVDLILKDMKDKYLEELIKEYKVHI